MPGPETPVSAWTGELRHEPFDLLHRIRALPIWQGDITASPLTGGITNVNYLVEDEGGKYVVRVGDDIPAASGHALQRACGLAARPMPRVCLRR